MSGIVGSRLNIRGSGLVGNLGTDGQVFTSSGAGQEMVFEDASGAVTALNNATQSELVSVGSTTTELDAEANLTFDGTTLTLGTGQIKFPASVNASTDANTLDDYEEGTFDGAWAGGSGTVTTNTDIDKFQYTKIGRVVYFVGSIAVESVSSPSGHKQINGLPFTIGGVDEGSMHAPCSVNAFDMNAGIAFIMAYCEHGGSAILVKEWSGSANQNMGDHLKAGTNLQLSGHYFI